MRIKEMGLEKGDRIRDPYPLGKIMQNPCPTNLYEVVEMRVDGIEVTSINRKGKGDGSTMFIPADASTFVKED